MAGLIGQTLSHYRVTAALGAGGMGEVYRATDTNLGRDVAIKVLPSEVAQDPERLARFQLEAHLLASLNHPHIAAIYGLEEADGKPFLALELVEGEDLKERLQKGAIPVDEAVAIAKQIAEALEEAHERGIVHRDLKPANVKVTPDGKVKVLDFGLAKAWEGPGAVSSDLSQSPTLALTGTAAGLILGTAAYMSPEQARGKSVDKRADIWAFGVVLWEMLTGRKLFAGETVTDTLAAVLKTDVDLEELPAATPPAIRQLLRRCLERQPKNRLHDIADARIAIDEILGGTPVDQPVALAAGFGGRALALVAIAAAVVGALVFWLLSGRGGSSVAASAQMRLSVGLPKGMGPGAGWPTQSLAISPDGRDLVFACVVGNDTQLCRRRLDRYGVEPLEGTVGARQPFFSPDGQWVGFFSRADGLSKVSLATGRVVNLVREIDVATWGFGGWCDDDRIVFAAWNSGLLSVSAEGGAVSTLARSESEWIEGPRCLPGGGTILYRAWGQKGMRIEALRIATGERRVVLEDASQPVFVAPDRLLFTRDRVPMLAPFDPARLAVTGAPTPVSERITIDSEISADPIPQLAVTGDGTLAYLASLEVGTSRTELVWIDRSGHETDAATLPGAVSAVNLAADDRHAVVVGRDRGGVRYQLVDLDRGTTTLVASTPGASQMSAAVLLPGDREFAFASSVVEKVSLEIAPLDGTSPPRHLLEVDGSYGAVQSVSGDGRYLAFSVYRPGQWSDLWYVDLAAAKPEPTSFLATPATEYTPRLSPDGRFVAYVSNESGEDAIYLRSFPDGGDRRRVSTAGGFDPAWRRDGRELFYAAGNLSLITMMSIPVEAGPGLRLGAPRKLFETAMQVGGDSARNFAVSADGSRFLVVRHEDSGISLSSSTDVRFEIRVVPGWAASLDGEGSGSRTP